MQPEAYLQSVRRTTTLNAHMPADSCVLSVQQDTNFLLLLLFLAVCQSQQQLPLLLHQQHRPPSPSPSALACARKRLYFRCQRACAGEDAINLTHKPS